MRCRSKIIGTVKKQPEREWKEEQKKGRNSLSWFVKVMNEWRVYHSGKRTQSGKRISGSHRGKKTRISLTRRIRGVGIRLRLFVL